MTDVVVPRSSSPGSSPQEASSPGTTAAPAPRVEVARGTDGRPVLLPRGVVLATAWAWRLAVIAIALYGLGFVVLGNTQAVTTPLLIAALLHPLYRRLCRGGGVLAHRGRRRRAGVRGQVRLRQVMITSRAPSRGAAVMWVTLRGGR